MFSEPLTGVRCSFKRYSYISSLAYTPLYGYYGDMKPWCVSDAATGSYTRGLGQLPADVDQLVLQSFLSEAQLLHGQRLVLVPVHLLVSQHQSLLQAVLGTASVARKVKEILLEMYSTPE